LGKSFLDYLWNIDIIIGLLKKCYIILGKPVFMYSMGGLAEYCVVPAHALTILPDSLPYAESAILGCAVFTAYGAMAHAAEVRPGDSVAVIGVGGVGSR
jgi:D-arabinose 1-dehydrogenase-like Zn-dependent alcohol dehydrogenase